MRHAVFGTLTLDAEKFIGNPGKIRPGPVRDKYQHFYTRATEILRLLRKAGAK